MWNKCNAADGSENNHECEAWREVKLGPVMSGELAIHLGQRELQ